MIERPSYITDIQAALQRSRIVALIGPRQSGKTTLAQMFVPPDSVNYFDLEDPISLIRLEELAARPGPARTVCLWALGRIGSPHSLPVLLSIIGNHSGFKLLNMAEQGLLGRP